MNPEDVNDELVEAGKRALVDAACAEAPNWPVREMAEAGAANLDRTIRMILVGALPKHEADVRTEDAKTVEAMRPETGMHVNTSEYRQGKYDALSLAAARLRSEAPDA